MGKWRQSLVRLSISMCSSVGKFGVITLCLEIVRCLERERGGGTGEIARLVNGGWREGRLCYMQTLYSCSQVWKRTAAEGAQCRDVRLCCSMLTTVGNEGAWLLPPKHRGWVPPRRLPGGGDWNGNSGSNASEGGSVSLSLPVSLSVHPAVLYYCQFLFTLTHNHSWHIITFSMFSSQIHMQASKFKGLQRIFHRFFLNFPSREPKFLFPFIKLLNNTEIIDKNYVQTAHFN